MKLDIDAIGTSMLNAAAGVLSREWPGIQACVTKAFEDEKEALADIARARLAGEINDDQMQSQLDDEKQVLTASLLACKVRTKAVAQNAINAALKVLTDAIQVALKAAI